MCDVLLLLTVTVALMDENEQKILHSRANVCVLCTQYILYTKVVLVVYVVRIPIFVNICPVHAANTYRVL